MPLTNAFPNRLGQYILGSLGFGMAFGSVVSVGVGIITSIFRIPKQWIRFFFQAYTRVVDLSLPKTLESMIEPDQRHFFLKILGFPGA